MLRLMLLRHAKSSWKEPQIADRERPLAERGRGAAPLIGRYASEHGLVPARILYSPARRARETYELFAAALDQPVPAEAVEELYDFGDGRALLEVARRRGGDTASLMLVGHNPSLENLARMLAVGGDADALAELRGKFPTAALAVIDCNAARWAELGPGCGKLVAFITPRGVEGAK
jgi:phosphohistidine phosphatase